MGNISSPFQVLRENSKIKQNEFAALLAVSAANLSMIESGLRPISPAILSKLAEMGVDTETLVSQHNEFMAAVKEKIQSRFINT